MFLVKAATKKVLPHHLLLAAIACAAAAVLTLLLPYEIALVKFVSAHRANWFVELMGDSLFELEQPGGGDLLVIFLIISSVLYLMSSLVDSNCSRLPPVARLQQVLLAKPKICAALRRHRLRLEFLVISSFCCSILMVKTLKWIMARPRPKLVLFGNESFSNWFEFGPFFLDGGLYRASFPSGHAALAVTLLGLAYLLIFSFPEQRRRRGGLVLLVAVLLFAGAMATARVMSIAHWPSDVFFSIFAGWMLIHCLFFYGLRVVDWQQGDYRYRGDDWQPPAWRAVWICWYLSLGCLALVIVVVGVRHLFYDRWPWLAFFSCAALPLLFYALRQTADMGLFRKNN